MQRVASNAIDISVLCSMVSGIGVLSWQNVGITVAIVAKI